MTHCHKYTNQLRVVQSIVNNTKLLRGHADTITNANDFHIFSNKICEMLSNYIINSEQLAPNQRRSDNVTYHNQPGQRTTESGPGEQP